MSDVADLGGAAPPGSVAPPLLEAEHLVRRYGGRAVVDVERLAVHAGEILAVLGPNGAGKSTLFRLLLLLESPDAGEIRVGGRAAGRRDEESRRRLAGVFQRPQLFTGSVRANVRFGLAATGVPRARRDERVDRMAAELGLSALLDEDTRRLSGGEAQRVALARALVLEADVLLLDEPTANLDVTVRRRFREELGRLLRHRAGAVVLITHDPADAFDLADRVAVMEAGRVVQVGTPEDLTTEPATPFVAAFTGAELLLDGRVEGMGEGTLDVRVGETRLVVRSPEGHLRPGDPVHVRYRPEDVVLAPVEATGPSSARNRLRMRVSATSPAGGMVRVRLEGPLTLASLITRGSAERLGITPGAEVTALLKTAALNVFLPDESHGG